MTKNQKYEAKLRAQGLKKTTVWLPEELEPELKELLEFFKNNKHCDPVLIARNRETNKFTKIS
ncbi:hypothetical protein [Pseudoalteromonas obscura]|uniref:Uncharacterized protein n=1 Tax=Pseudoalteromonas obscura TaxID=3048491 RepID=A0ABT7EK31_9GAMM|nr:hypothetical protein [Pseudoalteromonas sp. P94(2023)]MDK2595394.1 hypothetical protein [Pseudoalteromonas sp. P94(2023)]